MTNTTQNNTLIHRFLSVKQSLEACCQFSDVPVRLLAVSKTKSAEEIGVLFEQGQREFGENYLQEALTKIHALKDLDIVWHYIGHIQRNKTKDIATHFDWVQTLERAIIAKRLNEQRPEHLPVLNVLIQVNIDDEESKSGCKVDEIEPLVEQIKSCHRLCLRGLMIIPSRENTKAFARIKGVFDEIAERHQLPHWDTLSMGMSADMEEAVKHGSTLVRVGTAIFGER